MNDQLKLHSIYGEETVELALNEKKQASTNNFCLEKATEDNKKNKEIIYFVSDEKKFFVYAQPAFFHIIMDCLVYVAHIHGIFKQNLHLVIHSQINLDHYYSVKQSGEYQRNEYVDNLDLLIDFLDAHEIKFTLVDLYKFNIVANNYYIVEGANDYGSHVKEFSEFAQKAFGDQEVEPFRKVYLSRSHFYKGETDSEKEYGKLNTFFGYLFKSRRRLENERDLEKFLSEEYGFEVIHPERHFKNIEDQVRYMSSVKTLASLSSSGMTNMTFMKERTSLIEFCTPLSTVDFLEEYHTFYQYMSHFLNLRYTSIPHARKVDDIINHIKRNKYLDYILRS